ncbi:MAG: hypothetical protein ABH883_05765 [Candidatus Omnitrophota bacterium]
MKVFRFIFCVMVMISFVCGGRICLAEQEQESEYYLRDDPDFADALESYDKGEDYTEKGLREMRGRPGLAQKMFEHAEDYFLKAAYLYKNAGLELNRNVDKEVAHCEYMYRQVHILVNQARNKARGKN